MGLILNNNVEESKIMSAYGLTVYGKINRYVWTISDRAEENALITIRISDVEGNDIFSMNMGNNVILQSRIDDTMDNFLYWIAKDQPDTYDIEKQVFKSLCASNCLFNHSIRQKKQAEKRKEEEAQRIAERKAMEEKQIATITDYCKSKGLFFYISYGEVIILKATNNHDRYILAEAQKDDDKMLMVIDFIEKYPDNNGIKIVKQDTIENIINHIK
ncbi:MAG: hypothetical protein SO206_06820 [Bacilli bacterium]|nr:hypothetical protein [Bacilli bacterium]